jgi:excisionase family DNA binding protein
MRKPMEDTDLLQAFTVKEIAARLRTNENAVYALIRAGELRSVKPFKKAREHRVLAKDLMSYLNSLP